ncbi:hypothetical protein F383_30163 [Gossypium arboreum]|uniref:Uncharacterized protein n=1 Tax=Gossypium arboreum TaxID=29729 RepID=A0A0B0PGD2_GOSAR|nr:hypothetical protein F383_30163 [Gossypium arboreum]
MGMVSTKAFMIHTAWLLTHTALCNLTD